MRTSTPIWIIAILIILGGAGWYYYSTTAPAATTDTNVTVTTNTNATTTTSTPTSTPAATASPTNTTVRYTAAGFTPSTVTVAKGSSVTFINESGADMWVASAEHPDHMSFDGTTRSTHCGANYTGPKPFDQCAKTNSYTFTFTKSGTFNYHNHSESEDVGTVIVQ